MAGGSWLNFLPSLPNLKNVRWGAAGAGALGLGSLLAAASEFGDVQDPAGTTGNAVDAVGRGAGTAAGGLLGAGAGRLIAGAAGLPFGPVGMLALGTLGGVLGGEAGKGLTRGLSDVLFQTDPRNRELAYGQRLADVTREAKMRDMQALMPLQNQLERQQIANEMVRNQGLAALQRDQNFQNTLLTMLSNQSNMANAGVINAANAAMMF